MIVAPVVDLGRGSCTNVDGARRREWLITNGLGGYGSGTVSGAMTRRYHGLLIAALDPPLGRTLLVSHASERATYGGSSYALDTQQWEDDVLDPHGYLHLDRFHLEGTVPVWTYSCADALLEKRLWMKEGANTTYLQYTLGRARAPLELDIRVFVNYRDHHALTRAEDWEMSITPSGQGVQIRAFEDATPLFLQSAEASAEPQHNWYRNYYLKEEADRGLDHREDHLCGATFRASLTEGEAVTLTFSTETEAPLDGTSALSKKRSRDKELLTDSGLSEAPKDIEQLVLGADQFLVARSPGEDPDGRSVIAGYPWFGDWGRDTMIALRGLTLVTGRPQIAAQILRTYGQYVDQGMIPNRFPDEDGPPEYNTVDATLWYVEALRAYVDLTGDLELLDELFPVMQSIIEWHLQGTRYGIHADPRDGLLAAGAPGTQLTWMDAKVDDWVVTPRRGKPVEVNALWYNALRALATFAEQLGKNPDLYADRADQVAGSFDRFWNEDRGHCYDVIGSPEGTDAQLRPNQIFAVSLPHSTLSEERQRAVVDTCGADLLTPHGLRSLGPGETDYQGTYRGTREHRDGAYHQGTVWSWLLGPYAVAHYRVYGDKPRARSFLDSLRRHLGEHGLGSISEIFDGDPPFGPCGAPAQAWGVGQLLEAWARIEGLGPRDR